MTERIEQLPLSGEASQIELATALDRSVASGFDTILLSDASAGDAAAFDDYDSAVSSHHIHIERVAAACRACGLSLWVEIVPDADGRPTLFSNRRASGRWPRFAEEDALDPRRLAYARPAALPAIEPDDTLADLWRTVLGLWIAAGVEAFMCRTPERLPARFWRALIDQLRAAEPSLRWLAWTPGLAAGTVSTLTAAGFDTVCSSLAWWDGKAAWLVDEYERQRRAARSLAFPCDPDAGSECEKYPTTSAAMCRALWCAAALFDALLIPASLAAAVRSASGTASTRSIANCIEAVNSWLAASAVAAPARRGEMRLLTGPGSAVTAIAVASGADLRVAQSVRVVLINPEAERAATIAAANITVPLSGFGNFRLNASSVAKQALSHEPLTPLDAGGAIALAPAEVRILEGERIALVAAATPRGKRGRRDVEAALRAPRIAIEAITPAVDDGRFPIRRIAGETLRVEADAFIDGHEKLALALLWRAADEEAWRATAMEPQGNDRYAAAFFLERIGRYQFAIEAWRDTYATFRDELEKKFAAGLDVSLEVAEGRKLIVAAAAHAKATDSFDLSRRLDAIDSALGDHVDSAKARHRPRGKAKSSPPSFDQSGLAARVALLLASDTLADMGAADAKPFAVQSDPLPVDAERVGARFASWYELFPRSLGNRRGDERLRHGNFDDVIERLPAIRAMGFDVLYFPPIHPIGAKNRKGKNNNLVANIDDPGSPYAIGAADGGHDAIHAQLGTFEDFRRLRDAAYEHGLELAFDFAIQCSPDHPWLNEHPGWFAWRPDGSLRYSENPPKKYEDIVNVDFYAEEATPDLWLALRDIVLLWVGEGVRIFRVDNPHTKPLPFWEWLIADVRGKYPDTIFLAEAFTRPKPMHRLAKLGFSQSYTYFTWRHTKQEFTDYMTELTTSEAKDFFRPHFFVNTPDINPTFLQRSGRPGFLIRAALAATLSGLWGIYSGFELCEATPVAGKEEYLDSEKYEIRAWDWQRPGNIIAEIALLNRIRRENPALQTHLGIAFHNAFDANILYFSKATADRSNVVLVAINLDPHGVHEANIEVPLWDWMLPDHAALTVTDLVHDAHFLWRGKMQRVRLDPQALPFAIWRVAPA